MSTKKKVIYLSNKLIINEMKTLIEVFSDLTPEMKKNSEMFFDDFQKTLDNTLRKKYKFIEKVELKPELRELPISEQFYYLLMINIFVNVENLPNMNYVQSFIKYFHETNKWVSSFSNLTYYYKDEDYKEKGKELTTKVLKTINNTKSFLIQKYNLDKEDYDEIYNFFY